jgi:hypothetical protein
LRGLALLLRGRVLELLLLLLLLLLLRRLLGRLLQALPLLLLLLLLLTLLPEEELVLDVLLLQLLDDALLLLQLETQRHQLLHARHPIQLAGGGRALWRRRAHHELTRWRRRGRARRGRQLRALHASPRKLLHDLRGRELALRGARNAALLQVAANRHGRRLAEELAALCASRA